MGSSGGYGSYRGRSRLRAVLKGIIVLLAAVLIVAVAALLLLQRYMVFSADGLRFEFPFGQNQELPEEPDPLVVETPIPVVVTPTPEPGPEALRAVELPRSALYDGTAADQVAQAGGNAALFDMKGDDGSLGYISGLRLARDVRASASDPALNDAIETLNQGEVYTIARVSCFRDNALPYYRNDMALRSNSGNWKDDERIRWASPADESVTAYLTGICVELAQLGFDEILLDNAAYPTRGNRANIKVGEDYTPGSLDLAVDAFYAAVTQALEPYAVTLSIVATETALTAGEDAESGQRLAALVRSAHRVWVDAEDAAACVTALEGAGLADAQVNCVLFSAAATEEGSWAILLE